MEAEAKKIQKIQRIGNQNESPSGYIKSESSSGYRRSEGSSGHRKSNNKDIISFEFNEQGHYKSDYPKLQKEKPKK